MKNRDTIFAEYGDLPVLHGLVYALIKTKTADDALLTHQQLGDLLEQQLSCPVPREVIAAAVEAGVDANVFRRISGQGRADRLEFDRRRAMQLFERARLKRQSLIYRMLRIGEGQFSEEIKHITDEIDNQLNRDPSGSFASVRAALYGVRFQVGLAGPSDAKKIPLVYSDNTREVNWTKWGALAAIMAVPMAILLWWLS